VIAHDGFDRQLTTWLDDGARATKPDYLDETLAAIGNVQQRPSWRFPHRWLPESPAVHWGPRGGRMPILAILALLLIALLIGVAVAGALPRVPPPAPPPFGLARTGLLAFDKDGQIVLAERDGRGTRPLRSSRSAQFGGTFSRDGARIAFWQVDGTVLHDGVPKTASDLLIVDVDGSHAVNLTPELGVVARDLAPAGSWSPDGSSFVFTAEKDSHLYVVATDGSTAPRAIGDGSLLPMFPAWAPDGSLIAFTGLKLEPDGTLGVPNVYVIRPDGTGQAAISGERGYRPGGAVQWSPTGKAVVYAVDLVDPGATAKVDALGNALGPPLQKIVIAERGPTGWTERVVVERSASWLPNFSNDGSRIAFLRSRPDAWEGDMFVVGIDGRGERRVSDRVVNVSSPCWSPDDRTITMLTGLVPPAPVSLSGWSNQVYVTFPVDGARPVEIPAGTVNGILACSWQRLAP
jgi:Tol biopolymer transport system component